MTKQIGEYIESLGLLDGASSEAIAELEGKLSLQLPADYRAFMEGSNGAEGAIGEEGYLMLWAIEDIAELNDEYGVNEFAPGLVLFGSDGGDTGYAFDTRRSPLEIASVPFIGMDLKEAKRCGSTFNAFLRNLYEGAA